MISKTKSRFISILIITALGAAFFAGLRSTPVVMYHSISEYLKDNNFSDITILTNYGFDETDLDIIKSTTGVKSVQAGYRIDALMTLGDLEGAVSVYSLPEETENGINSPVLKDGRLPENGFEVLVDNALNFKGENVRIGDKITLANDNYEIEVEVVGLVSDVRYIVYHERGTNSLGTGKTDAFILVPEVTASKLATAKELEFILPNKDNVYNEVSIQVTGVEDLEIYSEGYLEIVEEVMANIKANLDIRGVAKLEEIKDYLNETYTIYNPFVESLSSTSYYYLDRTMNAGIESFNQDAAGIAAIAQIFPLMFFLVAALVSLTTLTRLVEEQRTQSGTMLALGYSKQAIVMQYVIYAFVATIIGCIIGIIGGEALFPTLILNLYKNAMYDTSAMKFIIDQDIIIVTVILSIIIAIGATLFASVKELMAMPATIMRPKAPKIGKRILLEKITFIWKRLSFNNKVTMRNIFRYKKRFMMSIIGIAGCTALLVTGFGLKTSIFGMLDKQFGEIWHYESTISFKNALNDDEVNSMTKELLSYDKLDDVMFAYNKGADINKVGGKKVMSATVVVPKSVEEFGRYINLPIENSNEYASLANSSVVLSLKAAEQLDIDVGDKMEMLIGDKRITVVVDAITAQHVMHYVYINPEYYQQIIGNLEYNVAYALLGDIISSEEDSLGKEIMRNEKISNVAFIGDTAESFHTKLNQLDLVTFILIISAAALAFVVLYNLTNININERKTEIATIKVLGFYPKEVADYVFKENVLLAIIGGGVGLVLGRYMHHYIVLTAETDTLMFIRYVNWESYVYAGILTIVFTLIINRFMSRYLRKVDMVESLKSIE